MAEEMGFFERERQAGRAFQDAQLADADLQEANYLINSNWPNVTYINKDTGETWSPRDDAKSGTSIKASVPSAARQQQLNDMALQPPVSALSNPEDYVESDMKLGRSGSLLGMLRNPSALEGMAVSGFAQGGFVPEMFKDRAPQPPAPTDTVPAMLTPGEVVIRKEVVEALGADILNKLNAIDVTQLPEDRDDKLLMLFQILASDDEDEEMDD